MKNSRTFGLAVAVALALTAAAPIAARQSSGQPPATSSTTPPSVTVNTAPPVIIRQRKPKLDKYKGRLLAFNIATIIVQSSDNQRMVRAFQYSTELRAKVADALSGSSLQPGDKVEVYCKPGTTVAVRVKARHTKLG